MSAGSNSFWNHVTSLFAGFLARASDVNAQFDGVAVGLDAVEAELNKCIQVTGVGMTTFDISANAATRADKVIGFNGGGDVVSLLVNPSTTAEAWATTTGALVEATDYSAKEYAIGTFVPAGSAKDWAITAENTLVDGAGYSALHWAAKAAASAATIALPAFVAGDARKVLRVNDAETGYAHASWGNEPIINLGAVGNGSQSVALNLALGQFFFVDMHSGASDNLGTLTLTVSNEPTDDDAIFAFHIIFRRGGRKTVAMPTGYVAAGGTAPAMGNTDASFDTWVLYREKHATTRKRYMLVDSA